MTIPSGSDVIMVLRNSTTGLWGIKFPGASSSDSAAAALLIAKNILAREKLDERIGLQHAALFSPTTPTL